MPINKEKYVGNINEIILRSSWELKFANWLDRHPDVVRWGCEIKAIPYFSRLDNCIKNYYPDFWVYLKSTTSEKRYIVEIKPNKETKQPTEFNKYEIATWIKNQDKWQACQKWAENKGFEFLILDEYKLGLKDARNTTK